MELKGFLTVAASLLATPTIAWDGAMAIPTARETLDIMVCTQKQLFPIHKRFYAAEGIISTPMPTKWRSRSVGTSTNGMREQASSGEYVPARNSPVSGEASKNQEEKLSGDSLREWPSFTRNVSLGKDYSKEKVEPLLYNSRSQSHKQDFFSEMNYRSAYLWSSVESPPSPKDAFRETCEFYGDPLLSREWTSSAQEFTTSKEYSRANLARETNKFHQPYPKSQDCYKSDSKLSYNESTSLKNSEIESTAPPPIGRSKSFHDLQNSTASVQTPQVSKEVQESIPFGISEHDLNRARSVVGLPIREPYNAYISTSGYRGSARDYRENAAEPSGNVRRGSRNYTKHGSSELDLGYDSQPASRRESMNVSRIKINLANEIINFFSCPILYQHQSLLLAHRTEDPIQTSAETHPVGKHEDIKDLPPSILTDLAVTHRPLEILDTGAMHPAGEKTCMSEEPATINKIF